MQTRIFKNALLVSAAMLGSTSVSSIAAAQSDSIGFEEIVVTAQQREQNLQDVPLAVTALNAAQIEQRFSRDLLDLGSIAPNIVIDPILGNGTAAISIRGIQLNDVEKSFDPPVGVYLDGVYLASTTGALLNIFDAETVEVLRGPQGTLFGRNTIGGLIHVRRARPTGELEGKVNVTYGSFDRFDIQGVINLPEVGDGVLKAKVAAVRLDGGGYFFNTTRNEREGDNNLFMISPQIQFNPNEDVEINLIYDYIRDRTDTRPVTALTTEGQAFFGLQPVGANDDEDFHRTTTTELEQLASLTTHSITLNASYALDDQNTFEAVVNYRDTDEDAIQDFDGTGVRAFDTRRPQQIDQFSAELRWHGDFDTLQVVSGVYYFTSDYNINQQTFLFGGEIPGTDYQQSAESYAVFAQADWEFVDKLTLTLGGRYLYDSKDACGGAGFGTPGLRNFDGLGAVSYGTCDEFRRTNGNFSNDLVDGDGVVVGQANGSESWDRFTPRIALTYELDNGIAFAAYSQGFRSGGFNGRGTNPSSLGPYDPELVKNYEIGVKTDWLDRRLIVNLTGFYTDYEDKQEDVVFPDPLGATVTVVQNAANATIWGLEAELRAMPAEGLSIGLNIGYLEAEYDEYLDSGPILDGPNAGELGVIDRSDFLLRRAPQWTIQADINYEYEIDANSSVIFAADYAFKDDYSIVANTVTINDPNPGLIDAFGLLNASISYQTERFKLSLFGRNLTDADYFQHVLDAATAFGRTADSTAPVPLGGFFTFGTLNPPRTWGIQGEVRF